MWTFIKSKFFIYINILLIVVIIIIGYLSHSCFEMVCAGCGTLFWLIQLRLSFILGKEEYMQKKRCRSVGVFMLVPALGMIAIGILILFQDRFDIFIGFEYTVIGLSGILSVCQMLQMIAIWKIKETTGRFMRQSIVAALSVPMSLVVVLLLYVIDTDNAIELGSMSTIVFGVVSLFFATNMIIVSSCGYKSTAGSIRMLRDLCRKHKLVFTRVSIIKDVFLVVVKTILSIAALSFFMFVNALYSAGMGIARFVALRMHTQKRAEQIVSYRYVGVIISAASICYVLYAVRLFFGGSSGVYDMYIALVIALYTFVEFGINIKEAIRLRGSNELAAKALRAISLSATLLCFVLTQTAIMSFTAEGDNSLVNVVLVYKSGHEKLNNL